MYVNRIVIVYYCVLNVLASSNRTAEKVGKKKGKVFKMLIIITWNVLTSIIIKSTITKHQPPEVGGNFDFLLRWAKKCTLGTGYRPTSFFYKVNQSVSV